MTRQPLATLLAALVLAPQAALAQSLPDLKRQDQWKQKEKNEFLQYLRSGQSAPIAGDVKAAPPGAAAREEASTTVKPRKPFYFTLGTATDTVFTVSGGGRVVREDTSIGAKALAGGHLFSWVRYYGGASYHRMDQALTDGTRAGVDHWQVPAGIELALVPLGTPQTRYVILRGGFTAHNFSSGAARSRFVTPLLGWQGTWNAGLGYEWQFADTNWRAHGIVEGYKSLVRHSSAPFFGLGFTVGLVRTF